MLPSGSGGISHAAACEDVPPSGGGEMLLGGSRGLQKGVQGTLTGFGRSPLNLIPAPCAD